MVTLETTSAQTSQDLDAKWQELYEMIDLEAFDTPDAIRLSTAEVQEVGGFDALWDAGWFKVVSLRDQHVFWPIPRRQRRRRAIADDMEHRLFQIRIKTLRTEELVPE